MAELMEKIPLEKFVFEGVSVLRVNDVTEQEVINQIKNRLLDINAFSDAAVYTELETYIQSLIGIKDLTIGITPFLRLTTTTFILIYIITIVSCSGIFIPLPRKMK